MPYETTFAVKASNGIFHAPNLLSLNEVALRV
jgi:hypothetical protein